MAKWSEYAKSSLQLSWQKRVLFCLPLVFNAEPSKKFLCNWKMLMEMQETEEKKLCKQNNWTIVICDPIVCHLHGVEHLEGMRCLKFHTILCITNEKMFCFTLKMNWQLHCFKFFVFFHQMNDVWLIYVNGTCMTKNSNSK